MALLARPTPRDAGRRHGRGRGGVQDSLSAQVRECVSAHVVCAQVRGCQSAWVRKCWGNEGVRGRTMVGLTIVAIVSAVIALVMTAIVVSMLRNERRRSDARVEALVRLANAEAPVVAAPVHAATAPSISPV